MQNKKVTFLKNLSKKKLEKKNNYNTKSDKNKNWMNSIYGFECANWTSKC